MNHDSRERDRAIVEWLGLRVEMEWPCWLDHETGEYEPLEEAGSTGFALPVCFSGNDAWVLPDYSDRAQTGTLLEALLRKGWLIVGGSASRISGDDSIGVTLGKYEDREIEVEGRGPTLAAAVADVAYKIATGGQG